MKFKDLEIGMKVKVISGGDFYLENVGKVGRIVRLDHGKRLDVKVSFDDQNDDTDWGNSFALERVEYEPTNSLEQQLLNNLIKNMEKASNSLNLEHLDALSKAYQRIKSVSNQTN